MGEKSALDIIAFDGVLTAQEAKASNDNVIINDKLIPIKSRLNQFHVGVLQTN